ncbi:MAG: tetratricopeptide (TPR) repeat protein [Candidatus Azotimanducaceae bacterium]|jgi:tetratricopeptide (TPR) repeat protein
MFFTALLFISLLALPVQAELSGIALERDLEYDNAIVQYQAEITAAEDALGQYDFSLYTPLMGLARSQQQSRDYDGAIASIQRAQHLSHRHEGVHTPLQLEGLEIMTQIYLAQDKPMMADKQQRFAFYVGSRYAGSDSLEALPAIEKLADWFTKTGQLHRARKLNEKGIEIVENHFGENTIKQLPYLQQLAKLKRLQRVCCSTRVMEQALSLVENNLEIPNELKATTYLEVADAYTISGDEDNAANYYQKAWGLMSPVIRQETFATPHRIVFSQPLNHHRSINTKVFRVEQDAFGRRDYRQVSRDDQLMMESLPPQEFVMTEDDDDYNVRIRDRTVSRDFEQEPAMRTVGTPFKFLHKQLLQILPNRFRHDEILAEVEMEFQFEVDIDGRVHNIELLTEDVPIKLERTMREVVRKSRFRPRMEDGILVTTKNYRLTQKFPQ